MKRYSLFFLFCSIYLLGKTQNLDTVLIVKCTIQDIKEIRDTPKLLMKINTIDISNINFLQNDKIIIDTTYSIKNKIITMTGGVKTNFMSCKFQQDTILIYVSLKNGKLYSFLDTDFIEKSIVIVFPELPVYLYKTKSSNDSIWAKYKKINQTFYIQDIHEKGYALEEIIFESVRENRESFINLPFLLLRKFNDFLSGYKLIGNNISDTLFEEVKIIKKEFYKRWVSSTFLPIKFKLEIEKYLFQIDDSYFLSYDRVNNIKSMLLQKDIRESEKMILLEHIKEINEKIDYYINFHKSKINLLEQEKKYIESNIQIY